jgi:hypothetical protein
MPRWSTMPIPDHRADSDMEKFMNKDEVEIQFIEDYATSSWVSLMDVCFWLVSQGHEDLAGGLARHLDDHPEAKVSGKAVREPDYRKWSRL